MTVAVTLLTVESNLAQISARLDRDIHVIALASYPIRALLFSASSP